MIPNARFRALIASLMLAVPALAEPSAIADCESCHGKAGASESAKVPNIGGLSAYYLEQSMAAYRGKQRPCPELEKSDGGKTNMCEIAAGLADADVQRLARHFAAQPVARFVQATDPVKRAAGAKVHDYLCEKCHADGGKDPDDDAGILAGQGMEWLRQEFASYADGARPMPEKMQAKFAKLSAADIDALIHFYAAGAE